MADAMVLQAQKWVNATYKNVSGYNLVTEDGKTGWNTMYSLTRALQHELGITALSDAFGPTTLSKLQAKGSIKIGESNENIVKIIQCGMYCKGYSAGAIDGQMSSATQSGINTMMQHMGLSPFYIDGTVRPKVFKALLTMDSYIFLSGGLEQIRFLQQWLNGRYFEKSTFFIGPCDGFFSRDAQQALMKGIQYESGIPEDQATGVFGPATVAGLKAHTLSEGDTGTWVQLFAGACVANGPSNTSGDIATFGNTFDADLADWVRKFQSFSAISQTGKADFDTWAQLLVSYGNPDRPVNACDTRFTITAQRAAALYDAGYRAVGRYLDEPAGSTLNKEIQPGELDAIFSAGLSVIPIWQYDASSLADFKYSNGYRHGSLAHARAEGYGFNRSTVIYFAVDYDATAADMDRIIDYFSGVNDALKSNGSKYICGVYGSRNVCASVSGGAYVPYAYVSGMSYGFSGNLGFPLPQNWTFNQIKEYDFTSGSDSFGLDRVAHRPGSDFGQKSVGDTGASPVEEFIAYVQTVYDAAVSYGKGDPNELSLQFMRWDKYTDSRWRALFGEVDDAFITYASGRGIGRSRDYAYTDPSMGVVINPDHLVASASGYFLKGNAGVGKANRAELASWGGDLLTFYGEWSRSDNASPLDFCRKTLCRPDVASTFALGDLIEDIDGFLVAQRLKDNGGTNIVDELKRILIGTGHLTRFSDFKLYRFGGVTSNIGTTAKAFLEDQIDDTLLSSTRALLIQRNCPLGKEPWNEFDSVMSEFYAGFTETLQNLIGQQVARRAKFLAAQKAEKG
ncbi:MULTISPECIES: glycoside hydrolase domain-containing protein [Streptomyces]|uniref:glycoside hydrolase domain-containing protein n=1 Tax=Streptomyces TaxID=1883 RepID=UPI001F0EB312|nr:MULTISPECIES: glycoside hydrolase domain-containing protein [Streptomyces]